MQKLLFLLSLSFSFSAQAADFDYAAYEDIELSAADVSLPVDPSVNYLLDAAQPRYHTVATYTGKTRHIDRATKSFIATWVKATKHPRSYRRFFQHEVEIVQGSKTYLMPIQEILLSPFKREVVAGTKVHLYVLLMGAASRAHVFAISEFNAVSG